MFAIVSAWFVLTAILVKTAQLSTLKSADGEPANRYITG
jgi:hypothetical protein